MATINQREVGRRHPDLRPGAARRPAPGAQGHPGRRDARRRDDLDRARGLGDGPPRALDAAHDRRREDDRPHRRASSRRTRSGRSARASRSRSRWIVSQRLVPKQGGGRIAICEILRSNSRTKEYVQEGEREGKSLQDAMEAGGLEGMQTFDQELEKLILAGDDRPRGRALLRHQPHEPPADARHAERHARRAAESIRLKEDDPRTGPAPCDPTRRSAAARARPSAGASPPAAAPPWTISSRGDPCRPSARSAPHGSRSTTRRSPTGRSRSSARVPGGLSLPGRSVRARREPRRAAGARRRPRRPRRA